MAHERAMPAESVGDVLEMARMRQLSGRLTIRPQRRGSSLVGELYLQAGRPVSARLGSMVGQEALSRLLNWRSIQYRFQSQEPGRSPSGLPVGQGEDAPTLPAPSDGDHLTGDEASRASSPGTGLPWQVPHRRDEDRDVLTLPLTRRQRVMYLLVDGQRTLSDLSRCSGKTLQEVELLVKELQVQGLVDI